MNFSNGVSRDIVFKQIAENLQLETLTIYKQDHSRPWGGFFVIDEREAEKFIRLYFSDLGNEVISSSGKLSPKILVVEPGKKLSWQFHHRRAEIWKLIGGAAGIVTSDTDEQKKIQHLKIGDTILLKQGERHRLIGLNEWGIVAEIWLHTDPANPSDEEDIVRLQDDFGR